jgi:hypothetical protein
MRPEQSFLTVKIFKLLLAACSGVTFKLSVDLQASCCGENKFNRKPDSIFYYRGFFVFLVSFKSYLSFSSRLAIDRQTF